LSSPEPRQCVRCGSTREVHRYEDELLCLGCYLKARREKLKAQADELIRQDEQAKQ